MKSKQKIKHVIFIGGETAGPVVPLIAIAKQWQETDPEIEPIFLDLRKSVAARLVPISGFRFLPVVSGKLRRYLTIKNLFSPILILYGFIQAVIILVRQKPILVMGAGGYIQVPVIFAAWLLRIPRMIHQQDIVPTISNKLCAPLANKITTTFEKSVKDFPQGLGFSRNYEQYQKAVWTGNPISIAFPTNFSEARLASQKLFKIDPEWPTVLVIGGGSGAQGLNQALLHNLPSLLKICQIIHSTGKGKMMRPPVDIAHGHDRYHQYEFIDQVDQAYLAADVVIARAGIGTITALSAFSKLSIIVPMPDSHQEWNAQYLFEKGAATVLDQSEIAPETFAKEVRKLLFDKQLQEDMQKKIHAIMPPSAAASILKEINKLTDESRTSTTK
jgi:UDP-N-acetylglucosamine--N-acetylmuramyl-(pentapeptide) pyrophosphoryl-undecaprenol N-acetylglucosamine transferase